ncbi:MAG: RdgB/HAM1 family non-canonical purine NTP pyrophosphatase [Spirochaetaceae bacterium]|jgi:XTP/dITP diphosphohydrolase|nr:RdgB/HAM1 family non-canonical purine NTP pyrophosphatase [Spirochaetaceae bacterium]
MTLWFATGNACKRAELADILAGHALKIPSDAGIRDFEPEEAGGSFFENALIKGRALYRLVKEPVIADDSGLCVDALQGRPGIYSSRYGGDMTAQERNALLLGRMAGAQERRARFVCAMVLLLSEERFYMAQETLEGEIMQEERGEGGFGYDPIFYIPALGRTAAELPAELKNRVSHRGKAGKILQSLIPAAGCPHRGIL